MFSNRNANGLRVCTLTGLEQNLADEIQGAPDGVNVAVGRPLQFKLFLARHNIKGSFKEVIVKLRACVGIGKWSHRPPKYFRLSRTHRDKRKAEELVSDFCHARNSTQTLGKHQSNSTHRLTAGYSPGRGISVGRHVWPFYMETLAFNIGKQEEEGRADRVPTIREVVWAHLQAACPLLPSPSKPTLCAENILFSINWILLR